MKKLFLFSLVLLGFSAGAFAQQTATASSIASATIVTPISITHDGTDMNFGNVSVSPLGGGTVVLATDGTRTAGGDVTLPATTGTVSAAVFTISGESGYAYTITLPSTDYLITGPTASDIMEVNNFVSLPTAGAQTLSAATQSLTVGATLNVGAAEASGVYTNATGFVVTINYN